VGLKELVNSSEESTNSLLGLASSLPELPDFSGELGSSFGELGSSPEELGGLKRELARYSRELCGANRELSRIFAMYFADLTPYAYERPNELRFTLNVGWLDESHPFPVGNVRDELVDKIKSLCFGRVASSLQYRGYHRCEFCSDVEGSIRGFTYKMPTEVDGRRVGSAVIIVPDAHGENFYFFPNLLIHYIQTHHYLPPEPFLQAIEAMDLASYNPQSVWDELINTNAA